MCEWQHSYRNILGINDLFSTAQVQYFFVLDLNKIYKLKK